MLAYGESVDQGEERSQVDALRARHPGWQFARPWYCGREWWEATGPGGARLLRREADELGEAIAALGAQSPAP